MDREHEDAKIYAKDSVDYEHQTNIQFKVSRK